MTPLFGSWSVTATPPAAFSHPSEIVGEWADAAVPGTVASSALDVPVGDVDSLDFWYRADLTVPEGSWRIEFDGLATHSEIFLDGDPVATSTSMFVPVHLDVAPGEVTIAIAFRSLDAHLKKRRPRGRWRSSMTDRQGLRWVRTSMLGRAPVFSGAPAIVGPFRPVRLVPRPTHDVRVWGEWMGGKAVLRLSGEASTPLTVSVDGGVFEVPIAGDGRVDESIVVEQARPWWPHTHGEPVTYSVDVNGVSTTVGFRSISLDAVSMTLSINGVPVFCRGGCWVPLDPVSVQNDPEVLDAALRAVREAGLNMIRLTGTMIYEDDAFFAACSRSGILVWQDVMFATVDPPEDAAFTAEALAEVRHLLRRRVNEPCLAVLSGGSETYQQPTMLGLEAEQSRMSLLDSAIPSLADKLAPGLPYVPSSPSGGDLLTHVGSGVAHYFGIGGYLRPLSDVRSAGVRFAAESLAFAVPPERRAVDTWFGSAAAAGHTPHWKAAVPRDRGSSWDFEDVRDHYVRTVFGVEPSSVRRDDPEFYLDLGRAVICEAVTEAYGFWRSARSDCAGALVLTLRDLEPGAGWGFSDSAGSPKAPWYALARASAPVAVLVTDAGMDGYRIDAVNDTAHDVVGDLRVRAFTGAGAVAAEGSLPIAMPARSVVATTADAVVGRFTDLSHAHRFGPRTFDAVETTLVVGDDVVAQDVRVVGGPALPRQNTVGLTAVGREVDGTWALDVRAEYAAQYVCVDVDGFAPSDSWFHLAPGVTRTLKLTTDTVGRKPSGHVRALNAVARGRVTVED
ncbi:glycosyl hydrolase [Rhodococcoides trifolii]|uniref:Glycosyl hydrolase n=1 Tax=Rhodococcoides trifolii TaxID=908250 RepID=A0A917G8I3_9NOCA|nr:beta-mannosidase [Rhodococcus trifolii]GGG28235.1 glycosyl hydrolase [Rhodococcus trifolii]